MVDEAHRFRETYDPWTGRAWLDIVGPKPERQRIGPGYGAVRRELRARFPDRPFDADWDDGRYWPAPYGWPIGPALTAALALAVAAIAGAALLGGPWAAFGVAALVGWPTLRLLDGVEVRADGIRVGPPWAAKVAWYHVEQVGIVGSTVWVRTKYGGGSGTVPPVLVPAVRARIRRLSGLDLVVRPTSSVRGDGDGGLDARYASWRAAATGIPWGVGLGAAVAAWLTPDPWAVLDAAGAVVVGLALLGGAVHARGTGWGVGAVLLLTALYAGIALLLGFATI
jgi:hypothetical protein